MMRNIFNLLLFVLSLSVVSCSDKEQEKEPEVGGFIKQNIPYDLCGTYYGVESENYYQYLTINSDGTMEGLHISGGKSFEERGECYYNEGKMIFYDKNWSQIYGAEKSIVEWTSEYLVLGSFLASFLTKSKQEPSFIGQERNEDIIGRWIYNQTADATSTLILNENGSGSEEFSSPVDYSYDDIVSWFTFHEWLYIKYDGKPGYTIWRYNLSGETLYLYYCAVLEIDSKYDYHRDNSVYNVSSAKIK